VGERFGQIVRRLADYPWWEVGIELLVLGAIVYVVYRFVRGTRAAGALKGMLLLLVVGTLVVRLVGNEQFPRLTALYYKFLTIALLVLVVTFQPELRRALIRLGETPFFRSSGADLKPVIDAVVAACRYLSKNKVGAILAIERQDGLRDIIETGKQLDADVSAALLQTIFWPNTPLHDMGVVIRGKKIVAASVQFPLIDPSDVAEPSLGTRHRAAIGLTRTSDAVVVVVSEETGAISIAEHGVLRRWIPADALADELTRLLTRGSAEPAARQRKAAGPVLARPQGDPGEGFADSPAQPADVREKTVA